MLPPARRRAEAADRPARQSGRAGAAPWPTSIAAARAECHRPARRFPAAVRDRPASTHAGPSDSGSPRRGLAREAAIFPLHTLQSDALAPRAVRDPPACPIPSADRPERGRAPIRRRCRSRSGSFPSHRLRIDPVIFGMAAEEPDHQHAGLILYGRDQAIVVAFDIEHDPAAFENAGPRMRYLHILGAGPSGTPGDREPDIVLRPRRPDAPVAPVRGEVALDGLGADDDHGSSNEPRWRRRQAYPALRKPAMKMGSCAIR